MSETTEVSAGRRRAALTLHALAALDREWLLEQLPTAERVALRDLLAELQDLGIPADADVIHSALAEAAPDAASTLPHAPGHARVLAREADAFRGPLVSLLAPAQREVMLVHWPLALEARPAPAAPSSWTPRLRGAMLNSWHDLAATEESKS